MKNSIFILAGLILVPSAPPAVRAAGNGDRPTAACIDIPHYFERRVAPRTVVDTHGIATPTRQPCRRGTDAATRAGNNENEIRHTATVRVASQCPSTNSLSLEGEGRGEGDKALIRLPSPCPSPEGRGNPLLMAPVSGR